MFFDTRGMPDIKPGEDGKTYKRICKYCKAVLEGNKRKCSNCGRLNE